MLYGIAFYDVSVVQLLEFYFYFLNDYFSLCVLLINNINILICFVGTNYLLINSSYWVLMEKILITVVKQFVIIKYTTCPMINSPDSD